ncbi:MAG: hypothetical protein II309_02945 [Bacilli bacterium]|nr:hypothetical protein [Bacilli bacterium]
MIINETHLNVLNSPVRTIQATVTLNDNMIFNHNTNLKRVTIERVGMGKFFGYGICQKANINVIDVNRNITVTTSNSFNISFNNDVMTPIFDVTEVNRDETTNELSITAYDSIYKTSNYNFSELELDAPYTMSDVITAIVNFIGLNGLDVPTNDIWSYSYDTGANLEGTETLREVLDDIAEATLTIYYVNASNKLVFKKLDKDGDSVFTIDKSKYFNLDSKTNRRLATICNTTELGDNVSASTTETGSTQYIRDNAFWELREDVGTLVNNAITDIGGLTINQFNCDWRGNYLLEIGDKISLVTKDNETVTSYLLNDTLTYDGTLSQTTEWTYEENEDETEDNPASIGDALKQTFAKVDKVNKQIDLMVSDVESNKESISALQLNTDSISASVSKVEEDLASTTEGVNEEIATLTQRVESVMTADEVKLEIKSELDNGVTKVETNTGFTFNDTGLTINKNDSEMSTTITEDGMTVHKNDEIVLVANNVGVEAKNLHATTYLIIGTNSRFEDYANSDGESRTGCFWIGS